MNIQDICTLLHCVHSMQQMYNTLFSSVVPNYKPVENQN